MNKRDEILKSSPEAIHRSQRALLEKEVLKLQDELTLTKDAARKSKAEATEGRLKLKLLTEEHDRLHLCHEEQKIQLQNKQIFIQSLLKQYDREKQKSESMEKTHEYKTSVEVKLSEEVRTLQRQKQELESKLAQEATLRRKSNVAESRMAAQLRDISAKIHHLEEENAHLKIMLEAKRINDSDDGNDDLQILCLQEEVETAPSFSDCEHEDGSDAPFLMTPRQATRTFSVKFFKSSDHTSRVFSEDFCNKVVMLETPRSTAHLSPKTKSHEETESPRTAKRQLTLNLADFEEVQPHADVQHPEKKLEEFLNLTIFSVLEKYKDCGMKKSELLHSILKNKIPFWKAHDYATNMIVQFQKASSKKTEIKIQVDQNSLWDVWFQAEEIVEVKLTFLEKYNYSIAVRADSPMLKLMEHLTPRPKDFKFMLEDKRIHPSDTYLSLGMTPESRIIVASEGVPAPDPSLPHSIGEFDQDAFYAVCPELTC